MPKIFISYRRDDSQIIAHRIYDTLAEKFGAESVFIDVDDIPPGDDFRDFLNQEIANSDVVLILIANKWAEIMRQRLRNPDDFVRIELVSALAQRKRVIPILLGDARMPNTQDLPERVRAVFPYLNAKTVGLTKNYHRDMQELIPLLENWETILPPRALPEESESPRRKFPRTPLLVFSLIMLLLVVAALAYPYISSMLAPVVETPSPSPTEAPSNTPESTEIIQVVTNTPTDSPSPTDSPTIETSPTPRGGGNLLVFSRSSDNSNVGKDIFVVDIASGSLNANQLSNDVYNDDTPVWSPDGSQIVYESFRNTWLIIVMNADGSEPFQLTANGVNSIHPHWSPDGEAIVFAQGTSGSREIYIQGLADTVANQLTNLDVDAFWPVWYSDEMIYFITDNPGSNWINRVNPESGDVETLASLGGNVTQFDISPDGSKFVYAMDSNSDSSFVPDIYVMDSATYEARNITAPLRVSETFAAHYNYPSWSPDGSQIVFMTSIVHNNEIYIMNADGGQLQRITNTTLWEWTSDWRP